MGLYAPRKALRSSNESHGIGVSSSRGAVSTGGNRFYSLVGGRFEIWNKRWTRNGTLSSLGGSGSIYALQPFRDRPVRLGVLHGAGSYQTRMMTVSVSVSGLSALLMGGGIMIPASDPIVPG